MTEPCSRSAHASQLRDRTGSIGVRMGTRRQRASRRRRLRCPRCSGVSLAGDGGGCCRSARSFFEPAMAAAATASVRARSSVFSRLDFLACEVRLLEGFSCSSISGGDASADASTASAVASACGSAEASSRSMTSSSASWPPSTEASSVPFLLSLDLRMLFSHLLPLPCDASSEDALFPSCPLLCCVAFLAAASFCCRCCPAY
mmetsp:Transcript_6110/g.14065  ORF Transcript_6110/g.14065 Transcript_6110/m.14065 type:complete len:203 (+) Transcript_6110:1-609(+)